MKTINRERRIVSNNTKYQKTITKLLGGQTK
jgi:hypothetical protein